MLLCPDASAGSAGPGPSPGRLPPGVYAQQLTPPGRLLPSPPCSEAPLSLLPQDDQSGSQELPRAHLQRAGGCRADQGTARWVAGPGAPPELSRPGPCQPRQHVVLRLGGEGPSFPGLGLGGLVPTGSSEQGPHLAPPRWPWSAKCSFYSTGAFSCLPVDPCSPASGFLVVNMTILCRREVRL